MKDAAQGWIPMLSQDRCRVRPGLARVDHDRKTKLPRHGEMPHKNLPLYFPWRKIIVVIETDLTYCHTPWMPRQLSKCRICRGLHTQRAVRMDADGGQEAIVRIGKADGRV